MQLLLAAHAKAHCRTIKCFQKALRIGDALHRLFDRGIINIARHQHLRPDENLFLDRDRAYPCSQIAADGHAFVDSSSRCLARLAD